MNILRQNITQPNVRSRNKDSQEDFLRLAINQSAVHLRPLWVSYILFCAYLIVTTLKITHRDLFLNNHVTLPVFNLQLGIQAYFYTASLLLLLLHLYLLMHVRYLDNQISQYKKAEKPTNKVRRYGLETLLFVQARVSPSENKWLAKLFDFCWFFALVALPWFTIFLMQMQSLAYHDFVMTLALRIFLIAESALIACYLWHESPYARRLIALPVILLALYVWCVEYVSPWTKHLVLSNEQIVTDKEAIEVALRKAQYTDKQQKNVDDKQNSSSLHETLIRSSRNRDFIGANFNGSSLHYTDFSGANLEGADFRNAKFEGAIFSNAKFRDTQFCKEDIQSSEYLRIAEREGKLKLSECYSISLLFEKKTGEGVPFGVGSILEIPVRFATTNKLGVLACEEKQLPTGQGGIFSLKFKVIKDSIPVTDCLNHDFTLKDTRFPSALCADVITSESEKYRFCYYPESDKLNGGKVPAKFEVQEYLKKIQGIGLDDLLLEIRQAWMKSDYIVNYYVVAKDTGSSMIHYGQEQFKCEYGKVCEASNSSADHNNTFYYHGQKYKIAFRLEEYGLIATITKDIPQATAQ